MECPSYLPPAAKVDKLHFKECLIELLQVGSPRCVQPHHVLQKSSLSSSKTCHFFFVFPLREALVPSQIRIRQTGMSCGKQM
jgi:hypothetical protein